MIFFWSVFVSCNVYQMSEKTFKDHILKGDKSVPWFVMFTSPHCPACVQAAPEFENAAERSRGFARFAIADTMRCPNIANSLGIRAVPSFFFFTETDTLEFRGARSAGAFLQFISESIGSGIEDAEDSWIDTTENKVILFTRRFKPPALFSAAYGAFKNKGVRFGMARDTETIEAFDNPPIPSIWMYKETGEKQMYKGKQEFINLIDSIAEFYGIELGDDSEL